MTRPSRSRPIFTSFTALMAVLAVGMLAMGVNAVAPMLLAADGEPAEVSGGYLNWGVRQRPDGSWGLLAPGQANFDAEAPVLRVPNSRRAALPLGDEFAWVGPAGQEAWVTANGDESNATGVLHVGFANPSLNRKLATDHPETVFGIGEVVGPGAYMAYRTNPDAGPSLAAPPRTDLPGYNFGTGTQRDGEPQGLLTSRTGFGTTFDLLNRFTAPGLYCITLLARFTLKDATETTTVTATSRIAVGDSVGADAPCGTASTEPPFVSDPDPDPDPDADPDPDPDPPGITILRQGHADVLYPEIDTDGTTQTLKLRAHIDGLGTVAHDDLIIAHPDVIKQQLPDAYTSAADYSFLGTAGSTVWTSPEAQVAGAPWIGMSTQSDTLDVLPRRQALAFRLDAVTGPGGQPAPGDVITWSAHGTPNTASGITHSTRQGLPSAEPFPQGGHGHFDWTFTRDGIYCMAFSVQTVMPDGATQEARGILTHVVGSAHDPRPVMPCARTETHPPRTPKPVITGDAEAPVVIDSGIMTIALTSPADDFAAHLDLADPYGAGLSTRYDIDDVILHRRAGYQQPYLALQGGGLGDLRDQILDLRVDTTGTSHAELAGIRWDITGIDGPGGVRASYASGDRAVAFDTIAGADNSYSLIPGAGVESGGWEVSRPGKYCIAMRWTATTTTGELLTDDHTLTLVVDGPRDPADFEPNPAGGQPWYVSAGPTFVHDADTLTKTCAQGGRATTAEEVAPPDPGSGSGPAAQTITATLDEDDLALAVSIPASDPEVPMSPSRLTPGGDRWWTEGRLHPVTVTDTRPSRPGWTVSGQIGSFSGPHGEFGGHYLGWTPRIRSQSADQRVDAGGVVVPGFSGGAGLSIGSVLAWARPGDGRGTARVDATLRLELPTNTPAGSYQATLTITAI